MKIPTLEELIGTALRTMVRRAVYSMPKKVFWTLFWVVAALYILVGNNWLFFIIAFFKGNS